MVNMNLLTLFDWLMKCGLNNMYIDFSNIEKLMEKMRKTWIDFQNGLASYEFHGKV